MNNNSASHRPTAVVTGASGGIGAELARELATKGHDLVLVARSTAQLETLAAELQSMHTISAQIITADLGKPGAGHALALDLAQRGIAVDVLVNNAGYADFGNMLTLNMGALTELMHDLIPGMVARKSGRVLNVASTAAFMPGPLMAAYYASKAYVLSLSEGVNEELKGTGVTVSALCPGPTQSGFQAAAAMEDSKLVKGKKIMSASKVAELGIAGMLKGKPVIVTGFKNKLQAISPKFTPRKLIPGMVKKAQAAAH
jgi:uncharacterized protein